MSLLEFEGNSNVKCSKLVGCTVYSSKYSYFSKFMPVSPSNCIYVTFVTEEGQPEIKPSGQIYAKVTFLYFELICLCSFNRCLCICITPSEKR